jgi:hypothetical protein
VLSYLRHLCVGQKLLWLSAFGISLIVGFALVLSTSCWPVEVKKLDRWKTFRLFFIPFCVSSYSLIISHQDFLLIFPHELKANFIAVLAICTFLLTVFVLQHKRD